LLTLSKFFFLIKLSLVELKFTTVLFKVLELNKILLIELVLKLLLFKNVFLFVKDKFFDNILFDKTRLSLVKFNVEELCLSLTKALELKSRF